MDYAFLNAAKVAVERRRRFFDIEIPEAMDQILRGLTYMGIVDTTHQIEETSMMIAGESVPALRIKIPALDPGDIHPGSILVNRHNGSLYADFNDDYTGVDAKSHYERHVAADGAREILEIISDHVQSWATAAYRGTSVKPRGLDNT